MRQRPIFFLVVFLLSFKGEIFGQAQDSRLKIPISYNTLANFGFENVTRLDYSGPVADSLIRIKKTCVDSTVKLSPPIFLFSRPVIMPSYYTNHLGFFCQKELQLQKITSIPFRFRLGSLDYVNYLEQKPNAVKPR